MDVNLHRPTAKSRPHMSPRVGVQHPRLPCELAAPIGSDESRIRARGDVHVPWNVGPFGRAIGGVHVDAVLCKHVGHDRAHVAAPVDDYDILGRQNSIRRNPVGNPGNHILDRRNSAGSRVPEPKTCPPGFSPALLFGNRRVFLIRNERTLTTMPRQGLHRRLPLPLSGSFFKCEKNTDLRPEYGRLFNDFQFVFENDELKESALLEVR